MRVSAAAVCVALVAASSVSAHAYDCDNPRLSTCIQGDTYWPSAGPARFISTRGVGITEAGTVSAGLVASFASRPLVLRVPTPGPAGSESAAIENVLTANVLVGWGVTRGLELSLALPFTPYQEGAGASAIAGGGPLPTAVMRDVRAAVAWAVAPRKSGTWGLGLRHDLVLPTGDRGSFASDGAVVFAPAVVTDFQWGRFFVSADAGARIRPTRQLLGAQVGTQISAAVGAGYDVLGQSELLVLTAEARMLAALDAQYVEVPGALGPVREPGGKAMIPGEWMAGVRSSPWLDGALGFELGGGGAIPFVGEASPFAPRFRFVFGVRYTPKPDRRGK